jgi:hypothetical protein
MRLAPPKDRPSSFYGTTLVGNDGVDVADCDADALIAEGWTVVDKQEQGDSAEDEVDNGR